MKTYVGWIVALVWCCIAVLAEFRRVRHARWIERELQKIIDHISEQIRAEKEKQAT